MSSTNDKLNHLRQKIKDSDFQHSRGLSNEVSYYILAYDAEDELQVREEVKSIESQLNHETVGVDILEFNVYDIMWKILDDMGIKDDVLEMESDEGMSYLIEQLNNALEMTDSENMFVKYMKDHIPDKDVVIFVTGIGEIFPLIRAHKILNSMHQIIDDVPVVLFYPGKYNSLNLSMFGEAIEDNYYRAFQID
ncbi:DUF1788 domain-containing protein [Companilactobacillus ginsenosidimutans]|uniref:ATP-binding protein n=1 Tax=Companilactobacillus ginsenosidimutans TaxID=1007676 RepID=A0A0H4QFJ0_9LACO|nr:DUF1788 domain-containing protein [Companilactobacillus ginsenosidimutans]AKP67179.1 ATP-binding protein [Companilactobacillus ginsenosidimutans]